MDRFWGKIAFGALGIFGLGMGGITLAKKGIHELKTTAIAGPVQAALRNLPTDLLKFRLDGRRIGTVRAVELENEGEWTDKSVQLTVTLEPGRAPVDLKDCQLATETMGHRKDAAFRCADADEIAGGDLVEIGTVRFEPGQITRPLFVEQHDLRRISRSELRSVKASLRSDDGKAIHGQAKFDLGNRRGGLERGTVRIDASDGRALIEVNGENGEELFRLRADDKGVSINAKDKRGKSLLKLLAGEAGVELHAEKP